MGPVGGPETSVLSHLTPINNAEDGRTKSNRGESNDLEHVSTSVISHISRNIMRLNNYDFTTKGLSFIIIIIIIIIINIVIIINYLLVGRHEKLEQNLYHLEMNCRFQQLGKIKLSLIDELNLSIFHISTWEFSTSSP